MLKIFYENYINDSTTTITAAQVVDSFYPLTNLLDPRTVKETRLSVAGDKFEIIIDLGSAREIDSILLSGNNVQRDSYISTINIYGNTSNSWTSPAYSTSANWDSEEIISYCNTGSKSYRYWKISLERTPNDNKIIKISNIFIGRAITLSSNDITNNWTHEKRDNTQVEKGRYGQKFFDTLNIQKVLSGSIEYMDITDHEKIQKWINYCSITEPFWLLIKGDTSICYNNELFYGYYYFVEVPIITCNYYRLYSTSFECEEVV